MSTQLTHLSVDPAKYQVCLEELGGDLSRLATYSVTIIYLVKDKELLLFKIKTTTTSTSTRTKKGSSARRHPGVARCTTRTSYPAQICIEAGREKRGCSASPSDPRPALRNDAAHPALATLAVQNGLRETQNIKYTLKNYHHYESKIFLRRI